MYLLHSAPRCWFTRLHLCNSHKSTSPPSLYKSTEYIFTQNSTNIQNNKYSTLRLSLRTFDTEQSWTGCLFKKSCFKVVDDLFTLCMSLLRLTDTKCLLLFVAYRYCQQGCCRVPALYYFSVTCNATFCGLFLNKTMKWQLALVFPQQSYEVQL